MDTLRRSMRKSFRRPSAKPRLPKDVLRLEITDLALDFAKLFQPHHIVIRVTRHRHTTSSNNVNWEASLKSPKEGFCFFHPPFRVDLKVTVDDEHTHKDLYISVENVDKKGKNKTLAKTRINLLDYKNFRGVTKLKLLAETKKVSRCHINVNFNSAEAEENDNQSKSDLVTIGDNPLSAPETAKNELKVDKLSQASHSIPSPTLSSKSSSVSKDALSQNRDDSSSDESVKRVETDSSPFQRSYTKPVNVSKAILESPEAKTDKEVDPPSNTTTPTKQKKNKVLNLFTPSRASDRSISLTPSKVNEEQEGILSWAKNKLRNYTQIKITNLSSSWRNGLAFCALIHTDYPELIPYEELKGHKADLNCKLALSASRLIGVEIPSAFLENSSALINVLNAATISLYLEKLKQALDNKENHVLDSVKVLEFKWKWMKQESFFKNEKFPDHFKPPNDIRHSILISDTSRLSFDDSRLSLDLSVNSEFSRQHSLVESELNLTNKSEKNESAGKKIVTDSVIKQVEKVSPVELKEVFEAPPDQEEKLESPVHTSSPTSATPTTTDTATPNRSKVLDLISKAHEEAEETEESEENKSSFQCQEESKLMQITKELKLLELENDRITHEQYLLEQTIRENDNAAVLPQYLKLVNEKNGLVRRQMQLNILEKEALIDLRQNEIRLEIQKYSDIADEKKTEQIRQREQNLLKEHVELVNQRNELVLHLDNEEKAIAEDETIEASLGNGKMGQNTKTKDEECVIQ